VVSLDPRANAQLLPKFHVALLASLAAFPMLILSSADNKVHFPTLYLFHFLKLYPPSNALLPEGRAGTAWEPSTRGNVPLKYNVIIYSFSSSVFKGLKGIVF
jgi:hypothetical protein